MKIQGGRHTSGSGSGRGCGVPRSLSMGTTALLRCEQLVFGPLFEFGDEVPRRSVVPADQSRLCSRLTHTNMMR